MYPHLGFKIFSAGFMVFTFQGLQVISNQLHSIHKELVKQTSLLHNQENTSKNSKMM